MNNSTLSLKVSGAVLLAMVAFAAHAAMPSGQEYLDQQKSPFKEVTYSCAKYTKNTVFKDRSTTDHNPIDQKTKVVQTADGYTIHQGSAFPRTFEVVNSYAGPSGNMAGNDTTLLLKKEDNDFMPYFIIYTFEEPKVKKGNKVEQPGEPKNLYVLAHCDVKE